MLCKAPYEYCLKIKIGFGVCKVCDKHDMKDATLREPKVKKISLSCLDFHNQFVKQLEHIKDEQAPSFEL